VKQALEGAMSESKMSSAPLNVVPNLSDVERAHALVMDENRPDSVARQHNRGALTARERIRILLDTDSQFLEYGALAQPARSDIAGAADGVIIGLGTVGGRDTFVVSFDYTVYGGSIGWNTDVKLERIFDLALARRCPIIMISEGGGLRAQEMGLPRRPFTRFRKLSLLSGVVPLVGVALGRSFGAHSIQLGMCDVVIGTPDTVMGIGGPPLVKAAFGLDVRPEDIGPADVHAKAGVLDVVAASEEEALIRAREYLQLATSRVGDYQSADETQVEEQLRSIVPKEARRAFDARKLVALVADSGTGIELRRGFGDAVITTFARLGGMSVGIIASNPAVLAGAIDAAGADKMARFIALCDFYGLPIIFLVDSPGFLVGRSAEEQGLIRHSLRVVFQLSRTTVPLATVVVRRMFGLAGVVMGDRMFNPVIHVSWPMADSAGMGPIGAALLAGKYGVRSSRDGDQNTKELSEVLDDIRFMGGALQAASQFKTDDVIDPGATRDVLIRALRTNPTPKPAGRVGIDPW
jgi:acetyl-CoA carboxylase carboxyltransferase component